MTTYPTAVDDGSSLPNPSGNSFVNVVDHAGLHDSENSAIIALEGKLGIGATAAAVATPFLLGTGAGQSAWSSAGAARTALGLGTLATLNTVDLTANVTGVLPVANGGSGVNSLAALAEEIGNLLMPIGFIYTTTVNTNPGSAIGFGTWAAFGGGRVLVGNGTSDQAFAAGNTGGESNHTLSSSEMPSHNHGFINALGFGAGPTNSAAPRVDVNSPATPFGTSISNTGGGGPHNNLQPYIVVYFWQRTA